ncbi:hypothetical protein B0H66DRAFT_602512 [Apodospora peruviana]|uniref:Secreted protein n=1 Tax=Apodospora peruviana TaxID=516989 RepID=A0AAE0I3H3_9PEZI|nr:hypothetical protein B0H66DRAFT_602512 [Apodospora peruviana]
MHFVQTLPLLAGLAAALPAIQQRADPAPAAVQIAEIAYSGSGCATASLAAQAVSDPTALTVPQKIFVAESGKNNSKVIDSRSTCQILIKLNHTAGWQFAVTKADYYGRVKIPLGVDSSSRTTYSFGAGSTEVAKQYYFVGPMDGFYYRNDRFVGTAMTYSPCGSGASLNLTSEVRVIPTGSGSSKPASMEIFNLLGGRLGISWKKC